MESSVQSPYVKEALKRATMQLEVLESAKRLAAYTAVDHHILPEHTVIGIGSGSTVPYVVDRIIQQGDKLNKNRVFIPTGFQSKELIVRGGLKLGDVDQYPTIDVTIDGADEQLNCLKGGGACHLREKVLAEAADIFVIVADYRKNTGLLGKSWKQGVPIEVAPFAYAKLLQNLHRLATLRMAKMKAGPIVTDNGNFCIDAPFDEAYMQDPHDVSPRVRSLPGWDHSCLGIPLIHPGTLFKYDILTHTYTAPCKIKMLTGVVEVGLFCGMAKAAYFGNEDGSVSVRYENGTSDTISASAVE
ncbi:Ribose 5-phosphate isomerase A (phosphoriboisomerase A) [Rhizoctonia solani]|uniref:Ribose-5-phosphate isomerase n=1 Tax=Rhizoctonia solani TaxID=456999 RepID=A0A8H7M4Q2_9AGAM|nr:Ribose 5-phosphate isomerase A (phosphoriboisomerase A) [Rhizoctonia solani]